MKKGEFFKLTDKEIREMFPEGTPPILTIEEASSMTKIPVGTLRDWRSRGYLDGCCRKVGKHVRFLRDRLIQKLFNEGLRPE